MTDTSGNSPTLVRSLQNLSNIGWLSTQPPAFQERMARIGRWVSLQRGAVLYAVGDESDGVFGLGEGLLDVAVPVSGDHEVLIHRAPPGFWVGESGLLAGSKRTISVSAAIDSKVFKLPSAAILRNLEENPTDWLCFYLLSHINATMAARALAEIISLPSGIRFARALLRLTGADGFVHVTQDELSKMVGMSRATFRRSISSLIKSGIVEVEYGRIHVKDRVALEAGANRTDA